MPYRLTPVQRLLLADCIRAGSSPARSRASGAVSGRPGQPAACRASASRASLRWRPTSSGPTTGPAAPTPSPGSGAGTGAPTPP